MPAESPPPREQILATPAGVAMDELIAEHVMGIKPRDVRVRGGDRAVRVWTDNPHLSDGTHSGESLLLYGCVRPYSDEVEAAWEVVEWVRACSLAVRFQTRNDDHAWTARFDRGPGPYWEAGAETMPLAVCRAALLAATEAK